MTLFNQGALRKEVERDRRDEEAAPPSAAAHDERDRLLASWMSLAQLQQQLSRALVGEINKLSAYVETEAGTLSARFQRLAASAHQQSEHVSRLTGLAAGVEVNGALVPITEIADLLSTTLGSVVEKILMLSKDSMSMVLVLENIGKNVGSVKGSLERLDKINRTTNMLALNARIEAERAGAAGAAFRVVAGEVRDLSQATHGLFTEMNTVLVTMVTGVEDGKVTLKRVATIDLSENIQAKSRLEGLVGSLVKRGQELEGIISNAATDAKMISEDVAAMVTAFQFQDRTSQVLKHVTEALSTIDAAFEEIKAATRPATQGIEVPASAYGEHVTKLLSRLTLSEVRGRLASQLDQSGSGAASAGQSQSVNSAGGDIELF